jgi:hypothetical protein
MPADHRPLATILAELAEVRRHLQDAPPHHGGGTTALRDRLTQLESELHLARRREAARGPAQRRESR